MNIPTGPLMPWDMEMLHYEQEMNERLRATRRFTVGEFAAMRDKSLTPCPHCHGTGAIPKHGR